jgi:hypothetical protein
VGVVTRVCVRLTPLPPAVRTMLLDFATVSQASAVVQGIIAAGVIPAALEMMDRNMTLAVEEFVHAGLPLDAAALLLVEVDGTRRGRCISVIDNPAADLLELESGALVPVTFVESVVSGVITVDVPEGLFSLHEPESGPESPTAPE